MKSLFTIIVFVSFVSLAIFGLFGMHSDRQSHDDGCIAATAQGMDCPKQSSALDYFTFHLDALKNFSTATFNDIAASLLILSLLAMGIAFGTLLWSLAPPKFIYCRLKRSDSFDPPFQYELVRWLALHENSPADL